MSKPTNSSIYLEGHNTLQQKFWCRVYHRGKYDVYITNFVPTAENGLLPKLEKVISIREISRWQDVGMSVIIADRKSGIRVHDIIEFLNEIAYTGNLYEVKICNG